MRDPETLARPWAVPGTPGLEHRIGGIEKADGSGDISYDPDNHQRMTDLRAAKVAGVADTYAPLEVTGDATMPTCWSSVGARPGVRSPRPSSGSAPTGQGRPGPPAPPQPAARGTWARSSAGTPKVLVPEMNLGQLLDAAARGVPGGCPVGHQGGRPAVHRRARSRWRSARPRHHGRSIERRRDRQRARRCTDDDHAGGHPDDRHGPTGRATRRFAGVRVAVTTRSSPRCSSRCPTWACVVRTSWWSAGSVARPGSRTT